VIHRWKAARPGQTRRRDGFVVWLFLHLLFFFTRHAPWFLWATRSMWIEWGWRINKHVRRTLLSNAGRILGPQAPLVQRTRYARAVLDSFFRFVVEMGQYTGAPRQQWLQCLESVHGVDLYRHTRAMHAGAIFVTAHLGSFEVGLAALSQYEPSIHVVFQRDTNSHFERVRSAVRRQWGVVEAAIEEGWPMWLRLREALRANEVVIMQGDRVLPGQKGVTVRFLHGHIRLPTGPARLAALSGSPIIPVFSLRQPDGRIRIMIEPPILSNSALPEAQQVDRTVRELGRLIEKHVRNDPRQWLVVQKMFVEDQEEASHGRIS
jgi:phosphatidylinositol dimannoside acyltransferase